MARGQGLFTWTSAVEAASHHCAVSLDCTPRLQATSILRVHRGVAALRLLRSRLSLSIPVTVQANRVSGLARPRLVSLAPGPGHCTHAPNSQRDCPRRSRHPSPPSSDARLDPPRARAVAVSALACVSHSRRKPRRRPTLLTTASSPATHSTCIFLHPPPIVPSALRT